MTAIAVIPARGGSRRIPHKNIRLFHGKPIIAYSIEAANASGLFERVVVSTDDREIGAIARAAGAFVFARDADDGERGTQGVTAEVLRDMSGADYACCIYATAPLMRLKSLVEAAGMLRPYTAYVYSVCGWRDAAQFYWGHSAAFLEGVPLEHWSSQRYGITEERYCDINTEADWARAEAMYAELHKGDV